MRHLLPVLLLGLLCCQAPAQPEAAKLSVAAGWLQRYLRLDTTNPPGHEELAVAFLEQILRERGIVTRRLTSPAGRTSLWARIQARPGIDGPALLLLHHTDVVAPGPDWHHQPFGGDLVDGRLYGRGAVDDKSLGIAELVAFLDTATTRVRRRDVILLAVPDEERGGAQGTSWLLAAHPELFRNVEGVLNEGGVNHVANGRVLWWGVEVAQKRPLWLEVTARGRAGHGATFNPQSATHKLIAALARLLALPLRWRVTPAARAYLNALAPIHNASWQLLLRTPEQVIRPQGPTRALLPGMENLFLDTVQINVLQGASQINVVPPEAKAQIDVRMLPDTDGDRLLAELRGALGADVETRVLLTEPPASASRTDTLLHSVLVRVLGNEGPVTPYFSPGFTDSRLFRRRGIAAYGISPFTPEPMDAMGVHGPDEHISVDAFDRGVDRMRSIVAEWISARE